MKSPRGYQDLYRSAVYWIAHNDDAVERDAHYVAQSLTVLLVADLFGKSADQVAAAVLLERERMDEDEPASGPTPLP